MSNPRIDIPKDRLAAFCGRWKVKELSLFGSVLREDFRPDSDVDVLVEFDPAAHWTLPDLAQMREELAGILGRAVDLLTGRGVRQSRNPLRSQAILSTAETVYEA